MKVKKFQTKLEHPGQANSEIKIEINNEDITYIFDYGDLDCLLEFFEISNVEEFAVTILQNITLKNKIIELLNLS